MSETTNRELLQTSPSLAWEGTEENCVSPQKATQDNQDTPTSQSKVSYWAHTSSVEAYCRHYGKIIDGPVPKWRLRSLYPNAPMTFSGPTPPHKRRRYGEYPEELSPVSSPCERLSLR